MVFYNFGLIAVYILMRKTKFVVNYTAASLSLLTFLATVRLFIPADFDFALVLKSTKIIPAIQDFLAYNIFGDSVTIGILLVAAWLLGTVVYLFRDIFLLYKSKQTEAGFICVNSEQVLRFSKEMGLRCRIIVSPDVREPFSAGILKPTIYLPDWELDEDELRTVLAHEYVHIRSFDALKKLVFLLLEALFWWNPISHIFRRQLDQLLEIQCDFKLTKKKDEKARLQYAETLFSVMKHITCPKSDPLYSCALASSANNMKQRFELILDGRKVEVTFAKALLYIALFSVFALSYFVIAQPYFEPPLQNIDGICLISEDNSFILKDGDEYTLFCNGEMLITITKEELVKSNAYRNLPIIEMSNNR